MRQILLPVLMVFSCGLTARAQHFGGNPSSMKWRQVNNAAARVIFPVGQDSAAGRVLAATDFLHQQQEGKLGDKQKKISVVLQPDVTYSNAYVGLAPWRSEYYLTPPQDPFYLGSINWADNLALHEWKHVDQYNNFNRGLSKVMGVLAGQGGRALANAMSVPDWFFEGDAVWSETVHTSQGRGRMPYFFNGFKSLERAGRHYPWMKLRNGSLRQLVPNHYDLGYLLVGYGREKYGDSIWQAVVQDASAFKGLFYPMQSAVKRHTGIKYSQFTTDALAWFNSRFAAQRQEEPRWITPLPKNQVVNYQYPYPGEAGETYVLKTAYRDIPAFYRIDPDGRETRIAVRDIGYDDYFSYRNGRLVYTAWQPDARWGNRDFSVIRLLEVATGKVETIRPKTKLFSPDINADGSRIVAVELPPGKLATLKVLDATGAELHSLSVPEAPMLSHPKFVRNDQEVVVAGRQDDGKMGWILWSPAAGTWKWILPPDRQVVGFPVVQQDELIYTGSREGMDAIYSLNVNGGEAKMLAAQATGIYQAYRKGEEIVGAVFTADGYRLAAMAPGTVPVAPAGPGQYAEFYLPQTLQGKRVLDSKPAPLPESTKYRKSHGFLNFHTWLPEISESEYTMSLLGNNVLNTTQTRLFYTWNNNERSSTAGGEFTYGGWYLQPFAAGQQTWGREVRYNADTTFIYNETELSAGLRLPLNLSFGKHYRYLTLSTSVHTDQVRWQDEAKKLLKDLDFNYVRMRLQYTGQIQKARQHIFPRFAQSLLVDYRTIINEYTAYQFLASGSLYLPGLSRNHNLVVSAAYQIRDTMRQYLFSNNFPFSRGYNSINYPQMFRVGVNYHFPLWYPDWGFGNMLYFLRVRANAFYDYTAGKSLRTGLVTPFNTVGGELYFDTRWWNQLPLSIGVRYSHLLDQAPGQPTQSGVWEIVLPVNLF